MKKLVLDATCGGRMMWFDKQNPIAIFVDQRDVDPGFVQQRPNFSVKPDAVMDFRHLEFDDNTFQLVVFDPPHLKSNAGDNSYMAKKYGKLPKDWQGYIRDGFAECMRVVRLNGVVIFKWNETQIPTAKIIEAIGVQPLFGHTTNNKGITKWLCFMKTDSIDG